MKFAVVDVETTGGKTYEDRVTEVGIVLTDGKQILERYSSLVNPERKIDTFVAQLTGITDDMVAKAPTFAEIVDEIDTLTQDCIFVAHNAGFDYSMFRKEYRRLEKTFKREKVCTINLAKKALPGFNSYGLDSICSELKVGIENRHRALGDAEATAIILQHILTIIDKESLQREINGGFSAKDIPENFDKSGFIDLPEDTGIFHIKDEQGSSLYCCFEKNLKKGIARFFTSKIRSYPYAQMLEHHCLLSYELSKHPLIGQLKEMHLQATLKPRFNKWLPIRNFRYGIYEETDRYGFKIIKVDRLQDGKAALFQFRTERIAKNAMRKIANANMAFPTLGLINQLKGKRQLDAYIKNYNNLQRKSLKRFYFQRAHAIYLFALDFSQTEFAAVKVRSGKITAIGIVDHDNPDSMEGLTPIFEHPNSLRILKTFMRKTKPVKAWNL